jgi:hypothetical protein
MHRLLHFFFGPNAVHELPSPLVHFLQWQICITILNFHSSTNFDGNHHFATLKTDDRTLFFFGACCKRGRHLYTTTAPSRRIPTSYCHLSAILKAMGIIVVNLQDKRTVFRIFIALLRFFIWISLVVSLCLKKMGQSVTEQTVTKPTLIYNIHRIWQLFSLNFSIVIASVLQCSRLSLNYIANGSLRIQEIVCYTQKDDAAFIFLYVCTMFWLK